MNLADLKWQPPTPEPITPAQAYGRNLDYFVDRALAKGYELTGEFRPAAYEDVYIGMLDGLPISGDHTQGPRLILRKRKKVKIIFTLDEGEQPRLPKDGEWVSHRTDGEFIQKTNHDWKEGARYIWKREVVEE
jgi:hypothetical protein